jgi:glutathionyl-hydroquinone reductase
MNVITKFLEQYSYRFPKGYPDLTDPSDKKLMREILSEIGINEAEENTDGTSSVTSFDDLLKSKTTLREETKTKISSVLSDEDKKKIVSNASNDIVKTISFLNSNSELIKKTFDILKIPGHF